MLPSAAKPWKTKKQAEGIPRQFSGQDSALSLLRAQVQSQTGELRLCKLPKQADSMCMHDQSLSTVRLFANPWTIAHQAPLSMEFSRQEYWSGCHFLLQGIFPT